LKKLSGTVRIDPKSLPFAVATILKKARITCDRNDDLVALPKARKNHVEISQTQQAHLRDSAAMCEFLYWLDKQQTGELSEIDVAIALEGFRLANPELLEISFDTISASGPNAALPHYRVTKGSDRILKQGEVILVDSGGQYLDGTTDITRTVAIGAQKPHVCGAFTRVLQGMIAISRLKFPKGTAGRDIDAIARAPLWSAGQDFAHGTGHGVGHFLTVHEGPQRISPKSTMPFEAGMIVSNEPGYYLEGEFGIRTENLLVVTPVKDSDFLEFQTLNFVPIDTKMVVKKMLSPEERIWLNDYHQICRDKISHRLTSNTSLWLNKATAPL
jgi:Xaa-Pro aminopeptidase